MPAFELSTETLAYVNSTPLEKRKELGQYMTPRSVADIAASFLPLNDGDKILDPAVGTGELLLSVLRRNPNVECFGWDVDERVLETAVKNLPDCSVLLHMNGLSNTDMNVFDGVIVNPPYFEFTPDVELKARYSGVISGRVNIYALFFQRVIEVLKPGGVAAFIVPPSMNNGAFFRALREYVLAHTEIVHLEVGEDSGLFIDALTAVQIIVLKKTMSPVVNDKYVVTLPSAKGSVPIFVGDANKVREYWVGRKSLYDLGYTSITGPLVWNQHKTQLKSEPNNGSLPVYYSKDIGSGGEILLNNKMNTRRYLDAGVKEPFSGRHVIVNRIVGGVGSGTLRAAIVDGEYFVENHVNVIVAREGVVPEVTLDELLDRLVSGSRVGEYIKIFTGNTQLSASELTYFLPL